MLQALDLVFSVGPPKCLGWHIAYMELSKIIFQVSFFQTPCIDDPHEHEAISKFMRYFDMSVVEPENAIIILPALDRRSKNN